MARLARSAGLRVLCALFALAFSARSSPVAAAPREPYPYKLPLSATFKGYEKFQRLMAKGRAGGWAALPIGPRTAKFGMALVGTPYVNYTLELDSRIEAPSVNMHGMDCWTFFETALAAARLSRANPDPGPVAVLRMIELDRYRGGRCDGKFTSRLHHLEDWLYDNARRGLVADVTPSLPGAQKLRRTLSYMGGSGARAFRQLRADPSLIPFMAKVEQRLSRDGIWYLPKARVAAAERLIQDGDILCIVTAWPGSYTSHVGLAVKQRDGTVRFLHASQLERKVVLDQRISSYLNSKRKHAGVMVVRPLDLPGFQDTPARR